MKLLLLLAAWGTSFAALAQVQDTIRFPVSPGTQLITYTEVIQAPTVTQAELYARAKLWFANTYKSAKSVIETDEKDAGIVQGTGWVPITVHFAGAKRPASEIRLWATIKISCRESRYRYEITNLQIETPPSVNFPTTPPPTPIEKSLELWSSQPKYVAGAVEYKQQVKDAMNGLRTILKEGMTKPAAGTSGGKSDW